MRIPEDGSKREDKVIDVINQCMRSAKQRRERYDRRRRWFLWGNDSTMAVRFNRIRGHVDLVESFLFTPEHLMLGITMGSGDDETQKKMTEALAIHLTNMMTDNSIGHTFGEAITWSLVFDTSFLKVGWNTARKFPFAKILDPSCFGVYDESEPELGSQQAFCHTFLLPASEAYQRLKSAGREKEFTQLSFTTSDSNGRNDSPLRSLIISSTAGPDLSSNLTGQVRTDYSLDTTYDPEPVSDMVRFNELWFWDDKSQDYATIVSSASGVIFSDTREIVRDIARTAAGADPKSWETRTNLFLPKKHPFIQITPHPLFDYFWGECHLERLIQLQAWTNLRLDQISDILERNVDPARSFVGFGGLTDEKAGNFGGPATWVLEDQNSGAKIDEFKPEMPQDLFREYDSIAKLFIEASGLTETLTGKGQSGNNSRGQTRQLATTGSGRIKKTALKLEQPLAQFADLLLELTMRNDPTILTAGDGRKFVAEQIEGDMSIRVAGHSHSPLFADDTKELAFALFKAGAIDKETLLRMTSPANVDNLVIKLRERMAMEAKMAASGITPPGTKEHDERNRSHHAKKPMA